MIVTKPICNLIKSFLNRFQMPDIIIKFIFQCFVSWLLPYSTVLIFCCSEPVEEAPQYSAPEFTSVIQPSQVGAQCFGECRPMSFMQLLTAFPSFFYSYATDVVLTYESNNWQFCKKMAEWFFWMHFKRCSSWKSTSSRTFQVKYRIG